MDDAHTILQRLAVRMLHDPAFRARVYAGPESLADLELPPKAHAMLTASDPRAWSIDPHRSSRVLKALLDEHVVSALALREDGVGLEAHHAFFGSDFFHGAVMRRESLALAFGAYLAGRASARARPFVALERAIARVRRRVRPQGGKPGDFTRGACEGCELPAGTLARWEALRSALHAEGDPIASILSGRRVPRLAPNARGRETEAVLIECRPGADPTVAFVGAALVALLAVGEGWQPRDRFATVARAEGASESEVDEIMGELVADGLLIGGAPEK